MYLARAAAEFGNLKRFVHTSTVSVHGHIQNPPANEASPIYSGDCYQDTKAEAERMIREFAHANRLPLSIPRPARIYGPGDRRLFKLFKMAHNGWIPVVGRGHQWYHLIHVQDLAECLITMATHQNALNEVIICAASEPIRFKEMVSIIAGVYGKKPRYVHCPERLAFLAASLCEALFPPLDLLIYRRLMRRAVGIQYRYRYRFSLDLLALHLDIGYWVLDIRY
jgi:nucleoside-diphosphate-sugar epimerase